MKKKVTSLPLKENSIITKSIEWYGDPEPCMIHRSVIMKTIYLGLFDYFKGMLKQGINTRPWCDIPDNLKQILDINTEINFVYIKLALKNTDIKGDELNGQPKRDKARSV